ncbi:hypothetical protein ABFS83_06G016900 [Erythranthe nasuta]
MIDPDSLASPPYISPSPSPYPPPNSDTVASDLSILFNSFPVPKLVFDLVTLSFIAALLLLCLIASAFIIQIQLKSRRAHHLQEFNSLWILRSLLVFLSSLWAVNEILRLPLLGKRHIYPFLPSITLQQQDNFCKIHAVLSLGFFEPGFLITLLFLVNVSIKKRNPRQTRSLVTVFILSSPMMLSNIFFVYFSPFEAQMPRFMHGSSVLSADKLGNRMVLCTYPFFSFLIFAAFTAVYAVAFLFSCWRVMAVVINKQIGNRINALASAVMVALPVQIVCLSLSWLWMPENVVYGCLVLAVFLCIAGSMAAGIFLLVVKPIREALETGENGCRWNLNGSLRRPAGDGEEGAGVQ